jgi:hypothetical protein
MEVICFNFLNSNNCQGRCICSKKLRHIRCILQQPSLVRDLPACLH